MARMVPAPTMPLAKMGLLTQVFLLGVICTPACETARRASQIDGSVSDDSAVGVDVGTDAPTRIDGDTDVGRTPKSTELPLPASAVTALHAIPGDDVYSALFTSGSSNYLYFDHYSDSFDDGSMWSVMLSGSEARTQPSDAALSSAQFFGAPSQTQEDAQRYMYAVSAGSLSEAATVERALWKDGAFDAFTPVSLGEPIGLLSWPRFYSLSAGRTAVVYRDNASVPKFAVSADGQSFGEAQVMGPPAAQPELGVFANGTMVYLYQTDVTTGFIQSVYRISKDDGESWSEATFVTTSSNNVHDADAFAREDGGIDVYYIYPDTAVGFALWRRCLRADGKLGAEEKVVVSSWGNLAKPRAHRLSDGRILLTFVDQNKGHLLNIASLSGDAVCL